jgi:hypothetical protein
VIGCEVTCDNDDFALDSGTVGIWCNLLELWNVFEFALVWNGGHELLAQGCKPSLCNGCHFYGTDEMKVCETEGAVGRLTRNLYSKERRRGERVDLKHHPPPA